MAIGERVKGLARLINPRKELFASTFTYGATAVVKIGSSFILTRLLNPTAYGIFGILLSLVYITELVSDVGIYAFVIRHPNGGGKRFIHVIWTIRLARSCLNFSVLFLAAPVIAHIYNEPVLTHALRLFSLQFLISGFESMSFVLAQRDRRARIGNYVSMLTGFAMTIFVIIVASYTHSYLALLYGVLLQSALTTISSYFFYRDIGVGFAFDRQILVEQFKFGRFVMPSSMLSIVLTQYDKLVLLKLFDLSLVGVYSIAGNMLSPISGIIVHNARVILYARSAEYFRSDPSHARARYYSENRRLLNIGALLPAIVAGFAPAFISILYDKRYVMVGPLLVVMALGTLISAFQNASENLLVAAGKTHMVLMANVIRFFTVIPGTLLGYYLFGIYGFVWFGTLAALILMSYFFWQQSRQGLLDLRIELRRLAAALLLFACCYVCSFMALKFLPAQWLHLSLKGHRLATRHP
jgi:O-antigen/teichoic acid export membrane protein